MRKRLATLAAAVTLASALAAPTSYAVPKTVTCTFTPVVGTPDGDTLASVTLTSGQYRKFLNLEANTVVVIGDYEIEKLDNVTVRINGKEYALLCA